MKSIAKLASIETVQKFLMCNDNDYETPLVMKLSRKFELYISEYLVAEIWKKQS